MYRLAQIQLFEFHSKEIIKYCRIPEYHYVMFMYKINKMHMNYRKLFIIILIIIIGTLDESKLWTLGLNTPCFLHLGFICSGVVCGFEHSVLKALACVLVVGTISIPVSKIKK